MVLDLRITCDKRIRLYKPTFIAFMDVEKAFDKVNWLIMFKKISVIYHTDKSQIQIAVIKITINL